MYLTYTQAMDKKLISELAGQALSSPITHVKKLGGIISYNYEVNHRYILKLPSERTTPDDWLRQSAYMSALQQSLSFQIPQPQIKPLHHLPKSNPILSLSYPKIEGHCIANTDAFAQKDQKFKIHFFEQLVEAAQQIHETPLSALPLSLPSKQEIFEEYYFKHFLKKEATPLEKKLFQKVVYHPDLGLGKSAFKTSILVHADLHAGNVVLNDKNQLIGLLDFDSLGRGDRFWEFRPKLYKNPKDTYLFQEIYSQKTGHNIKQEDIDHLYQFYDSIGQLAVLFQLYNSARPKGQKNLEKKFKKMIALAKELKRNQR